MATGTYDIVRRIVLVAIIIFAILLMSKGTVMLINHIDKEIQLYHSQTLCDEKCMSNKIYSHANADICYHECE